MAAAYGDRFVTGWGAAALLALLMGAGTADAPEQRTQYAQLILRQRIIIRVPARLRPAPASPIHWKESAGPKCVPARAIVGASMISQDSVDLILRDNRRIRARLENSCPALDYYYGFYITPNPDGMICADRDIIRSRVGGQCGIDRFRTLRAERRD
jgi:hypothetical protein